MLFSSSFPSSCILSCILLMELYICAQTPAFYVTVRLQLHFPNERQRGDVRVCVSGIPGQFTSREHASGYSHSILVFISFIPSISQSMGVALTL